MALRAVTGTHETAEGQFVAGWFGRIAGTTPIAPYAAMGWADDRGLRSAALFNDYNGANIELHLVGIVRRQIVRDILRYAFLQQKVQRITAKPYRSSFALRRSLERHGFKPEGVMQRYYGPTPAADAFVFRLDRDSAEKWMT